MDGKVCVWDSSGVKDDTIFGKRREEDTEVSDDDCEAVKDAIKIIDRYIRH